MNPKVSVLMPIYNGGRYLRLAIDSILEQSLSDFEIIAVNDSSTDDSRDIVLSYSDPRVRLIDNPRNLGQTGSLQVALEAARGEYIARQDQDDVSLPERFAKQVAYFAQCSDIGVLGTSYCVINELTQVVDGTAAAYSPETVSEMAWRLLWTDRLVDSSVMARRAVAVKVGGYNRAYRYAQDYDLWLRMSFEVGVARLTDVLLQLRIHGLNASNMFAEAQEREAHEILRDTLTRFVPISLEDAARVWRVDTLEQSHPIADVLLTVEIVQSVFRVFKSGIERSEMSSVKRAFAEKLIKIAFKNRTVLGPRAIAVLFRAWAGYPALPFQPATVAGWWQQRRQARRYRDFVSAEWTD